MKKMIVLLTVVALLLCCVPTVFAAGGAYWSGPDTVRAGDTFTLHFYAGGGILGGNGTVSYDSSVLTLQGYTGTLGGTWAVELSGNTFVFYDNTMENPLTGYSSIFRATFTVNAGVAPGTAINVSASGLLSDGNQDFGFGCSYQKTVAKPLSANCNLASLTVTGAAISPAFSPSVTNYSAKVPFATSSIGVSAKAEDAGAKVSVSNPTLTPGATTYVKITVTAENGATKTYTIAVAREQDPNYVESNNANLSSLSVEGYALSPAFDPAVTQYYVWLPYEVDSISVSASTEDKKANYAVGTCSGLVAGQGTDIAVTVTAEDGSEKVYTITAVRAPELEKTPEYLTGVRETLPTEPEETQPTETEPAPTEPVAEPENMPVGYPVWALALAGAIGAAVGAGLMAAILAIFKKK